MKKILLISPGYPSKNDTSFSFVKQLVEAMVEVSDVKITVLAPQSLTRILLLKKKYIKPSYGESVEVFRPVVFSFSNGKWQERVNFTSKRISIINVAKQLSKEEHFDCVYGHFMHMGIIAAEIGEILGIPSFVACGESSIEIENYICSKRINRYLSKIKRFICVSSELKRICTEKYHIPESKCTVLVNGVDINVFKPYDRIEARNRLQIPQDFFVVSFVGAFCERKGNKRLDEAIVMLQNTGMKIGAIYIGRGNFQPKSQNVFFMGSVKHEDIPSFLSAADIFVLPTQAEGCCNAIIEAMACGLPVISSNEEFNYDILDDSCAVLINPNDVEDIANAIKLMNTSDSVKLMSKASRKKANGMSIKVRALRILDLINSD